MGNCAATSAAPAGAAWCGEHTKDGDEPVTAVFEAICQPQEHRGPGDQLALQVWIGHWEREQPVGDSAHDLDPGYQLTPGPPIPPASPLTYDGRHSAALGSISGEAMRNRIQIVAQ
jgi:hypothetical protein